MPEVYTKGEIDRAGIRLASSVDPYREADAVRAVNYWRRVHRLPLKRMLDEIWPRVGDLGDVLVVGRIKKFDTIVGKLRRPDTPNKLKTMYDIAGCRVVVGDSGALQAVCSRMASVPGYDAVKWGKRDYIAKPKDSGYRGVEVFPSTWPAHHPTSSTDFRRIAQSQCPRAASMR